MLRPMKASLELLTLPDVSKYLKLHAQTTYKLVREQQIPMLKVGGQWRIRMGTLQRWLDGQEERMLKNGKLRRRR